MCSYWTESSVLPLHADCYSRPMNPPAPVLSSRLVYEGRIFDVAVDRVRLPHGREANFEIVRHEGSVVLVPIDEEGRVLLVRQYRHAAGRFLWELPAGSLESGEDPESGARRECHEELGLIAGTLDNLGTFWPTPGFCTEVMTFFRATGLRVPGPADEPAHQDEDESIEVGRFTRAEIGRMIRRGEIADLKTVAGLSLLG